MGNRVFSINSAGTTGYIYGKKASATHLYIIIKKMNYITIIVNALRIILTFFILRFPQSSSCFKNK